MKENSIIYFKQNIHNDGIRYGCYKSDELYNGSIYIDVYEIYLDFNTGHYSCISRIERVYPFFDDLVEISEDEFLKVKSLYNDYNVINSLFDVHFLKLY